MSRLLVRLAGRRVRWRRARLPPPDRERRPGVRLGTPGQVPDDRDSADRDPDRAPYPTRPRHEIPVRATRAAVAGVRRLGDARLPGALPAWRQAEDVRTEDRS